MVIGQSLVLELHLRHRCTNVSYMQLAPRINWRCAVDHTNLETEAQEPQLGAMEAVEGRVGMLVVE